MFLLGRKWTKLTATGSLSVMNTTALLLQNLSEEPGPLMRAQKKGSKPWPPWCRPLWSESVPALVPRPLGIAVKKVPLLGRDSLPHLSSFGHSPICSYQSKKVFMERVRTCPAVPQPEIELTSENKLDW